MGHKWSINFYKFITDTLGIDYVKVTVDNSYYKRILKTDHFLMLTIWGNLFLKPNQLNEKVKRDTSAAQLCPGYRKQEM